MNILFIFITRIRMHIETKGETDTHTLIYKIASTQIIVGGMGFNS